MRVLGDINPRSESRPDPSVRDDQSRHSEGRERLHHGPGGITDIPLRITDERYRLECDRRREDAVWQEIEARRASPSIAATTSVATAAEEPEVRRSTIDDTPVDLGSVSNDLTQEQRERAANELFARLGYAKLVPRQRAGAPWKVVLVLVLVLAALVGYGYLAMRQNGVSARQLPGVQTTIMLDHDFRAAQSRVSAALQAASQDADRLIAAGRERWAHWRR